MSWLGFGGGCGPGAGACVAPSCAPKWSPAWWLDYGCLGGACGTDWPRQGCAPGYYSQPVCPSVFVSGSCCDNCAEGKPCCGAETQTQSQGVGALYVSDDELNALGENVSLMSGDVNAAVESEHVATPGGGPIASAATHAVWQLCKDQKGTWDPTALRCDFEKPDPTGASFGSEPSSPPRPLTRFRDDRWTPFAMRWNDYRAQTVHEPTVYDMLRTELASLRDEWTGPLGQATRATVPERKPGGLTLAGISDLPWGWIAFGAVVLSLPFVLPPLAGAYLALTRGKALLPALGAAL